MNPERETPHPSCAADPGFCHPHGKKLCLTLRWNFLCASLWPLLLVLRISLSIKPKPRIFTRNISIHLLHNHTSSSQLLNQQRNGTAPFLEQGAKLAQGLRVTLPCLLEEGHKRGGVRNQGRCSTASLPNISKLNSYSTAWKCSSPWVIASMVLIQN